MLAPSRSPTCMAGGGGATTVTIRLQVFVWLVLSATVSVTE